MKHVKEIDENENTIIMTQVENEPLGEMYRLIDQLTPLITANYGRNKIEAVLLDKENPESVFRLGDYEFTFRHSYTLG